MTNTQAAAGPDCDPDVLRAKHRGESHARLTDGVENRRAAGTVAGLEIDWA